MSFTLVAIEGPLKGTLLPLNGTEVSIGREESNTLSIDDLSASRHHCKISRDGDSFKLTDLSSRNGTLVNGKAVREHLLKQGDQIQVGASVFLFSQGATAPAGNPVELDDRSVISTTTRLFSQESVYLHAKQLESMLPSPGTARDLKTLLEISTAVQDAQTVEGLAHRVLELLLEAIPAERAAVLVTGGSTDSFESTFGLDRGGNSRQPVRVYPAVARRVLTDRMAIVVDNSEDSATNVRSVIAAPLVCGEELHGVIYADTSDPKTRFVESHLQLVTAAGAIAGMALASVRRLDALHAENQRLQAEINIRHDMIGESEPMIEIYRQIDRAAPTAASILIQGESGTGKELVARAIHRNSLRALKPFVAINCAALTETLLESELFGHERGAFTGALNMRKGRFEAADGGTLFLDEIGEMAPVLQVKLLRVLQEHEFERVGGTKPIRVDIRVIAATNKDLNAEVKKGAFRQDLYYRLKVISIHMPALRQRRKDIPPLATHFLRGYSEKAGRKVTGFSQDARAWMLQYDWPGNVRELQHAIEQAVIMSRSELVRLSDLREAVIDSGEVESTTPTRYHDAIEQARRQVIGQALEQAGGVYTEAAKLLGLHPVHLHRLVRELNMRPELKIKEFPKVV
ncbi:MAG: hypothetical protein DMG59_00710 [Acidobacteria bacterium]|nr:MAG: hypothetical protein DMG59_00710 [Acidobacteriota bacterium]